MMDAEDLKQAAGAAVRQVGAVLDRNPAIALAAAVAVGFFAGLLLRRKEKTARENAAAGE
jgi:ElaB/YqjD/DUF883 family membrane-anchored ribosome-binding protein